MIPRRKIYIQKNETRMLMSSMFSKEDSGGYISDFENQFAKYIGVKNAVAVGSGRMGMELLLKALSVGENDEVIVPAYSLKALPKLLKLKAIKPVAVDVEKDSFNICPKEIENKINASTKAIIATHIFGAPCNIEKIVEIARKHNVFVLEDCAHSLGAEFNGKQTGSFGDASFFSFDVIKPINTYGGGMVVTNDDDLAKRIREYNVSSKMCAGFVVKRIVFSMLENIFLPTIVLKPMLSLLASKKWNKTIYQFYRNAQKTSVPSAVFTGFQARIGIEKLSNINNVQKERRRKAEALKNKVKKNITFQKVGDKYKANYYFLVGLLSSKSLWEIRKFLLNKNIDAGIYSEITDDCSEFAVDQCCKNADYIYKHALQFPLHHSLSEDDIDKIAKIINSFD